MRNYKSNLIVIRVGINNHFIRNMLLNCSTLSINLILTTFNLYPSYDTLAQVDKTDKKTLHDKIQHLFKFIGSVTHWLAVRITPYTDHWVPRFGIM